MSVSTSPHALSHSLDLLADTYNYNHWIYSLIRPYCGDQICEIGAGTGNLTRFLLPARKVVCVEPEPAFAGTLHALADIHRNLCVVEMGLEQYVAGRAPDEKVDTVACVNVLEHFEKDGEALSLMASILKPEGVIVLYVPAGEWAYGVLDRALGHYRRYSKRRLARVAREAGLSVATCRYVNFVGVFGWFWQARVAKATRIAPDKARLMDRMVPLLSAAERLVPPLLGQSLFAVLKKA